MGFFSELALPKGFDAVWGLCTDTITSKIKSSAEQQKINKKLEVYLSRKLKDNWFCTREEEIDFEGLVYYIRGDLLGDVEICLCGQTKERELARKNILVKAVAYASANTTLSRQRAQKMVSNVIEILKDFWFSQVPKDLRLMSGEIVDNINHNTDEQVQKISDKINYSTDEIKNEIFKSATMSLDKNAQLLQSGKISTVEDNLNVTLNGLAGQHKIPDFFKYQAQYIGGKYRFVSIPIHPDACKLYPPKIKGIADFKIDGVDKRLWEHNIFDYANRHQLEITMTVRDAEKYLGAIKDPSQVEAEMMKGKDYIISPKPFPPAFPCSIIGDDNTIVNYLLLRTIDISDEGIYTITNDEQKGRQFKFELKFNSKNKKTDFNFSAEGFGNKGRLEVLKVIKALRQCTDIKIYLLETNEELLRGYFKTWEYTGLGSIEDEISFYERVLDIEKYFHKQLKIPPSISAAEVESLEYVSELIRGGVCEAEWNALNCSFNIEEEIKEAFLNPSNKEFEIQFNSTIEVNLWGNKLLVPIRRIYICAKLENYEKLKQKIEVLDVGDSTKVTFIPGSGGNRVEDRLLII